MTARRMAVALGVLLLATAGVVRAQDDKAVHRGDGGGSHSSGAESRHPSQDVHSSSGSSSGGGSYAPEAFSSRSGAEQRHPRPGTGTGHRGYGYGSYGSYG